MLRLIGLTLVVTAAAQVAQAADRFDGPVARAVTAAQHSPTRERATGLHLQIGGGLIFAPTGQDRRHGNFDLTGIEPQERGRRLARTRTTAGGSEDWLAPGARSQPGLAYAVNNALSLGLDYRYQDGESMNFKVAKVGGLEPNYHSHKIMLEARLEF